jgi:hypothetical protein
MHCDAGGRIGSELLRSMLRQGPEISDYRRSREAALARIAEGYSDLARNIV